MAQDKTFERIVEFIRELFPMYRETVPLHAPVFSGREKEYVDQCIDSTFVSSVGGFVTDFEQKITDYTGAKHAIATMNGTAGLHMALLLADVQPGDLVLTQSLTFVATANAISYTGAQPVFLDVDDDRPCLSPGALEAFLQTTCLKDEKGMAVEKKSKKRIAACVPVHGLGHPARMKQIIEICNELNIPVIEDAAESLGSSIQDKHTGTFGQLGVLSFNGNKIITTGGGGMILTEDPELAKRARHLTTTAKMDHPWDYTHDEVGYNYRLPNLNAAMGCAQMEQAEGYVSNKRQTASLYAGFFHGLNVPFLVEPDQCRSNYWLNGIRFNDKKERDQFLAFSAQNKVQTRPLWTPLHRLPMYGHCLRDDLVQTISWWKQTVNLPSGVRL